MQKYLVLGFSLLLVAFLLVSCEQPLVSPEGSQAMKQSSTVVGTLSKGGGFDGFGYNYTARVFVGAADGVDRALDGAVWGDPTYANDHLVMKWSKGWDNARFHGEPWGPDAWLNNEWNGKVPGGSGEIWHYKIVWVGPELEDSPYWREGGYDALWGEFEVIFSHGTIANEHFWDAHARPSGYGLF